ncbi:MAG: hypothetical protein PHP48_00620, partial [Bacteroidales bacterium]|nr:hypothetical protein [Bacteroidales bacterium]
PISSFHDPSLTSVCFSTFTPASSTVTLKATEVVLPALSVIVPSRRAVTDSGKSMKIVVVNVSSLNVESTRV